MASSFILGGTSPTSLFSIALALLNRHGIITGATGTGKTRTLQKLAESFSAAGIPVIFPDVKGDLSGLSSPAQLNDSITQRLTTLGLTNFVPRSYPLTYWSLQSGMGHPLQTTVTEIGPLLLSRMIDLNDTQESALTVLFQLADKEGLLLIDTSDLEALLTWALELPEEVSAQTGTLAKATLSTIKRKLLSSSLSSLLGSPSLNLFDMMIKSSSGEGMINLIDARQALTNGASYALFLCWLLSEFFEELPEVGDLPQPRLVLFFDEAHLLFKNSSTELRSQLEQVIRLIRSKGVGIFFVTQNVSDIPDTVLSQLAHRIHHAVRAYTPADKKDLRALASTLRAHDSFTHDSFNVEEALLNLGIGEALVSTLDDGGRPTPVEKILIAPPTSSMAPASNDDIQRQIRASALFGKYDTITNPHSAAEVIAQKISASHSLSLKESISKKTESKDSWISDTMKKTLSGIASSVLRSASSKIGREITRGILGSMSRR